MFVVLSVVVRQSGLHLFTNPLFQVVTLTHELVELLGAAQLLTTTAASVFQLRDLSLQACLSHTIQVVKVI